MEPEPTSELNALCHAFLAMLDATAMLYHQALETSAAEDVRRITGIRGPDWLTGDLWQAAESWRGMMDELEPLLPYIGDALAVYPLPAEALASWTDDDGQAAPDCQADDDGPGAVPEPLEQAA